MNSNVTDARGCSVSARPHEELWLANENQHARKKKLLEQKIHGKEQHTYRYLQISEAPWFTVHTLDMCRQFQINPDEDIWGPRMICA